MFFLISCNIDRYCAPGGPCEPKALNTVSVVLTDDGSVLQRSPTHLLFKPYVYEQQPIRRKFA